LARFIHLTPEKNVKAILRGGIKVGATWSPRDVPQGVFLMPVTSHFYISHQWLRELKRTGQRTIVGVYVCIPDDEPVWVGHYNVNHRSVSAVEAAGLIRKLGTTAEGYEVILPRKVDTNEIHAVRNLPQVLGWRYQPESHSKPYCGCIVCVPPGTPRARIKNVTWEKRNSDEGGGRRMVR
jgi:hypothetical protein